MILLSLASLALVAGSCWTLGCYLGDILARTLDKALGSNHPAWKGNGA